MATLLLAVIYIMFIGIGVPDSLFGVAWPAIYPEFSVGVSSANLVTMTVAGCTIISSLLSARLISRFGTSIVTAVSTAMTAFALFGLMTIVRLRTNHYGVHTSYILRKNFPVRE